MDRVLENRLSSGGRRRGEHVSSVREITALFD